MRPRTPIILLAVLLSGCSTTPSATAPLSTPGSPRMAVDPIETPVPATLPPHREPTPIVDSTTLSVSMIPDPPHSTPYSVGDDAVVDAVVEDATGKPNAAPVLFKQTYRTSATPEEIQTFYDTTLGAAGWTILRHPKSKRATSLLYTNQATMETGAVTTIADPASEAGSLVIVKSTRSVAVIPDPADALAVLTFQGGIMRPTDEPDPFFSILPDGRFAYMDDGYAIHTGQLEAHDLTLLSAVIQTTDVVAIKRRPVVGACPTHQAEPEELYRFMFVHGQEILHACSVNIDRTLPLFQTLNTIIAKYSPYKR